MKQLTEEEFLNTQFKRNHLDLNASWGGLMFETFGEELEFVNQQNANTIWTILDTDDDVTVVTGFRLINRIGYMISEEPFTDEAYYTNEI